MTGSHNDPDISDAMDKFGDFGYSGFFIILDIYGQEFNHLDGDGYMRISKAFLQRKLRKRWTKVELLLHFFSKEISEPRFLWRDDGASILIQVPKFINLASNWTGRKKSKDLQRVSVAPTAIEGEGEGEKINTPPNPPAQKPRAGMNEYHHPEYQKNKTIALEILHEINERCGKNFLDIYTVGINTIMDRLNEGRLKEQFSQIITTKLCDPHFQEQPNLYRPETLFNRDRFDTYLNESPEGFTKPKKSERSEYGHGDNFGEAFTGDEVEGEDD